ncbi:FGGY family carbohydrate kinase [Jiulongibacter sp. NS-SX5]|uniref:FGGY family carbohydrate kinase n=1 Tax=Jiulongibacter sp. NS-SX5 TaxID=3463854 RepID=UPI0040591FB0
MKNACLVFDVLHHFKYVTVFDENFSILYSKKEKKTYSSDEDGVECEDLPGLIQWIKEEIETHKNASKYKLKAVNFTSYVGAMVHLDGNHQLIMPVYDIRRNLGYKITKSIEKALEPYPNWKTDLQVTEYSFQTVGFQLLWLKNTKPELFAKAKKSLSLAQYFQSIFTGEYFHDYSTVGCHSACWSFDQNDYHQWINDQGFHSFKLPVKESTSFIEKDGIAYGSGLYSKIAELQSFKSIESDQFIFLSTGGWTACLNPFNNRTASLSELPNNSFSILNREGKPVRMARLFSGNEHARQVQHLSRHFHQTPEHCLQIKFDRAIVKKLRQTVSQVRPEGTELGAMFDSPFMERNLNLFSCIEEAYHQFIMDLVAQQIASIRLTIDHQINRKIYVEGGLAKNSVFMNLLSEAFYDKTIYKVNFRNTASIGAALAIKEAWTTESFSAETLELAAI